MKIFPFLSSNTRDIAAKVFVDDANDGYYKVRPRYPLGDGFNDTTLHPIFVSGVSSRAIPAAFTYCTASYYHSSANTCQPFFFSLYFYLEQ